MKFGEFLMGQGTVDKAKLKEALAMQVDNPGLKLGEILVSLDLIKVQQLFDLMQKYVEETGADVDEMQEWLSQKEIDVLIAKLRA